MAQVTRRTFAEGIGGASWMLSWPARAQVSQERRWRIVGTARTNSRGPSNPYFVLSLPEVQEIAVAALDGPLSRHSVERALSGSEVGLEHLLATDVLAADRVGRFRLAFTVVPREDMLLLRSVASLAGRSLADALLERRDAFETAFASYELAHVDRGVLAMALVGCVVLDWDGLGVAVSEGMRTPPVLKPNGDKYLMTMLEAAPDVSVRGLYWGSHSNVGGDPALAFTTFGDHETPERLAFPDLVGLISDDDLPDYIGPDLRAAIAATLSDALRGRQDTIARVLMRLREGPIAADAFGVDEVTRNLLTRLSYVKRERGAWYAAAPVLTHARDADMIESVRTIGRDVVRTWLRENYDPVRAQLAGLRSVAAGVPYERVFTRVWHDLFGWANHYLSHSGMLCDPYGPHALWEGYVPFVWEESMRLYEGTGIF